MQATGGLPPYVWSAFKLPPGFSMSSSGLITGVSVVPTENQIQVRITDQQCPGCAGFFIDFTFTVSSGNPQLDATLLGGSSTDSVYVFDYPSTGLQFSLPPGTPEVVTPLMTALLTACAPAQTVVASIPYPEQGYLHQTGLTICAPVYRSAFFIAGVGGLVGVFIFPRAFGSPGCGVAIVAYLAFAGVAPPGAIC